MFLLKMQEAKWLENARNISIVGLGIVEMKEDEKSRILRQSNAVVKYSKSFLALLLPILWGQKAKGIFVNLLYCQLRIW